MVIDDASRRTSASPIHDVAYLARSDHRVPALVALTTRPRSRSELCELAGVSSSTIRRTIREFEDRHWVRKDGYQYEATRLGTVVASGMERLLEQLETERRFRRVWQWLPESVCEFDPETWAEITVTVAEPDAPYRPVNRFETLLSDASSVRFCKPEIALMEPCLDVLFRLVESGIDVTLIDRPGCHAYFVSTYPERSSTMIRRENFTVLEHEDLPSYGIGLLDDQVFVSCYERDSGVVQAVLDTDASTVREWAASEYASYEREAHPLEYTANSNV